MTDNNKTSACHSRQVKSSEADTYVSAKHGSLLEPITDECKSFMRLLDEGFTFSNDNNPLADSKSLTPGLLEVAAWL